MTAQLTKQEKQRNYYENNKEKLQEKSRAYYQQHKDEINLYSKNYREEHLDYFKEYNQRPETKKTMCIGRWRNRGILHDNWDAMYDVYKATTNCQVCDVELCEGIKGGNKKCLDHHHATGIVLGIVCHTCNIRDTLSKRYDKLIAINTL